MAIPEIKEKYQTQIPVEFEKELVEEIFEVARFKRVEEGDIIVDIDERIRFIPLLLSGAIKITREDEEDHEILLYYLGPGQTCATSLTCCLANEKSTIRAVAEENTEFLAIPIHYLDTWMNKYPSWKTFVMTTYAIRFEELLGAIDQLAFKKMDERLAKYLHNKAKLHNSAELNISHQDIAYDLNTSREVVSRLLKQLEKLGNIKLGRNKISIIDLNVV